MLAKVPSLTKRQEREIVRLSRHYITEGMTAIQKDLDALWLMAIASTFEVEPEELEAVYKELYAIRAEYMEFYESDGYDGLIEIAAKHKLRDLGVDIDELQKDMPRLVKTEFTKGETQSLREARERRTYGNHT